MASQEIQIKQEPAEEADLEGRILELCKQNPKGITDVIIKKEMPQYTPQDLIAVINQLLTSNKLCLLKSGSQLIYKLQDPEAANKVKGGDTEEQVMYQIIEEAGNKGIWIKDIRQKSNLPLTAVNKILKSLESKKVIKAVKSVSASRKKIYMLASLEPDRSITGGAWYNDQDFDMEFVEILNQQCFRFLEQQLESAKKAHSEPMAQRNASFVSSADVHSYITELRISNISLGVEDIETILDTLIYDGKVERALVAQGEGHTKLYRAIQPVIQHTPLMRSPCGVCPVFNECHVGGVVSPATCVYMKEWLERVERDIEDMA